MKAIEQYFRVVLFIISGENGMTIHDRMKAIGNCFHVQLFYFAVKQQRWI